MRRLLNVLLVIFSFQTFALASGISGGTNPNVNISSAGASNLSVNADGGLNVHTVNSSGSSGSGGGPIQTLTVSGSTTTVGYQVGASSVPVNVLNTVGITGSISNTGFNVNNTPPVSQSGAWTVTPGTGTFPISGTISISGTPSVTISGTPAVTASQTGTYTVTPGSGTANGSTGSAVPAKADYIGGNGSGNLTGIVVCDNWTAISQTANTQIITGTSAKKTYICAINLVTATAQNIAIIGGTGSTCGTSPHAIAGGTTAATGWNLAANGGLTQGSGLGVIMQAATAADNLCVFQSGSGQVSGTIAWTQF